MHWRERMLLLKFGRRIRSGWVAATQQANPGHLSLANPGHRQPCVVLVLTKLRQQALFVAVEVKRVPASNPPIVANAPGR